jgi:hypothetical protein
MASGVWKPYHALHPQFDAENWEAWAKFREENPYVEEQGIVFTRIKTDKDR